MAPQTDEAVDAHIERLVNILDHPEEFFQPNEKICQELREIIKFLFDYSKANEKKKFGPLPELYIEGLDSESIWEELVLRLTPALRHLRKQCRRLAQAPSLSLAKDFAGVENEGDNGKNDASNEEEFAGEIKLQEEDSDNDFDVEAGDGIEAEAEEDDGEEKSDKEDEDDKDDATDSPSQKTKEAKPPKEPKEKGDLNYDGFFNWDDMEKFAEEEEKDEMGEDSEAEDDDSKPGPFGNVDDESEDDDDEEGLFDKEGGPEIPGGKAKDLKFSDFFGAMEKKLEEEEEGEGQSTHQRHKEKIAEQIDELEQEALAEKPWIMKGETGAADRPENSLLEAHLDVERAFRAAPRLTEETTAALEDVIKKRILEDAFDDVVPRTAPKVDGGRAELPEVSTEKSKAGLGELYEKEYLKQVMGVEDEDPNKAEKEEMAKIFKKLCYKLDSLSNFHFTPKPVIPDLQVKVNVPAIALEEVLPAAVSAADALAPEEVHAKAKGRKGVLQAREEMEQEERKRARAGKKAARRKDRQRKEADKRLVAKLNPGMGNPYEKEKILESLKSKNVVEGKNLQSSSGDPDGSSDFKTSAKFFAKLQEQTSKEFANAADSHKNRGESMGNKRRKKGSKSASLKL
eukprot:CAMPEP_0206377766 /NCGR_PEP_ID=MMETSP0294-20121207/10359_1 /ASSEMBLY_ACC=CAM_ASM_000327 /TAXON_ID=39354 /ORGANISM="Heterosigma akashiwo, Strain CCMP2393" /LENGTH=626 /DNA_ID=CAMNT_0053826317 /DNA_START=21 /DNA_END=1901 /DNA_ORIENTATION=+